MNKPPSKTTVNDYLNLLKKDDRYALTKPGQQMFGEMLSEGLRSGRITKEEYDQIQQARQLRLQEVMNTPLVDPYTGKSATKYFAPRQTEYSKATGQQEQPREVLQTGKDLFVGGSMRPDVLSSDILNFRQNVIKGAEQEQAAEQERLNQILSLLQPKPTDVGAYFRLAGRRIGGAVEGAGTMLGAMGVPGFAKPSPEQLGSMLLDDYSSITPETALEGVSQEGRTFGMNVAGQIPALITGSFLSRAAQPISAVTGVAGSRYSGVIQPAISAALSYFGSVGGEKLKEMRMRSVYGDKVYDEQIAPILAQANVENPQMAFAAGLATVPMQGGLSLKSGIGMRAFGGTLLNTLRNKPTDIIGRASELGPMAQKLDDFAASGQILQNAVNAPNKFSEFQTAFLRKIGQTSSEAIDNVVRFKPTGGLGERLGQFASLQKTMPGMAETAADLIGEQATNLGFSLFDYTNAWNQYKQGLLPEPPSISEALINLGMGSLFIKDNAFQNIVGGIGAGIGRGALYAGSKIPGISSGVDFLAKRYIQGNEGYVRAMAEQQFSDIRRGVVPSPVGGARQRMGGIADAGIGARNLQGNEVPIVIGNGQVAAYDPSANNVRLLNYGDVFPVAASSEKASIGGQFAQQIQDLPVDRIGKGVLGKLSYFGGQDIVAQEGEAKQQLVGIAGNHVIIRENPEGNNAQYSIVRVADLEPGNQQRAQSMFDAIGVAPATDPYNFNPMLPRTGAPSLFDIKAEQTDIESLFPSGSKENKLIKEWFKTTANFGKDLKLRGRIVGSAANGDALVQLMGYDTAIIRINPVNLDSQTITAPADVVSLEDILNEGSISEAKKQYLRVAPSLIDDPSSGLFVKNIGKKPIAVAMTRTQMSQFNAALPALQRAIEGIDQSLDPALQQQMANKYANNLLDSILKPTFKKTNSEYQLGSLLSAETARGIETGVVIDNTPYGPIVAFGSNDWKGVVVQDKAIKTGTKIKVQAEAEELAAEKQPDSTPKAEQPAKKRKQKTEPKEGMPVEAKTEPSTQEDIDATEQYPGDYSDVVNKFRDHVLNKMTDAQRRAINGFDRFIQIAELDPESGEWSKTRDIPLFDADGNNLYHSAIKKIVGNNASKLTRAERAVLAALNSPAWQSGKNIQFWQSQLMVVNFLTNPKLRKLVRKLFDLSQDPDFKEQVPNIFVNDETAADEDIPEIPPAPSVPTQVDNISDFDIEPVTPEEEIPSPSKPIDLGPAPKKKSDRIVISDEMIIAFLDEFDKANITGATEFVEQRRLIVAESVLADMSQDYRDAAARYATLNTALQELDAAYAELQLTNQPKKVLAEAKEYLDIVRNSVGRISNLMLQARIDLIKNATQKQSDIDAALKDAAGQLAQQPAITPEEDERLADVPVIVEEQDIPKDNPGPSAKNWWLDSLLSAQIKDFPNWKSILESSIGKNDFSDFIQNKTYATSDVDSLVDAYETTGDLNYSLNRFSNRLKIKAIYNRIVQIQTFLQNAMLEFQDANGKYPDIEYPKKPISEYQANFNGRFVAIRHVVRLLDAHISAFSAHIRIADIETKRKLDALVAKRIADRAETQEAEVAARRKPKRIPDPIINEDNAIKDRKPIDIASDIKSPIREVNIDDLYVDPNRFQFRAIHSGSDQFGASGSTAEIENWDEELAGIINVWTDPANGRTYVVNGHNRYALAKRLGVPKLLIRSMKAVTADDALVKGALINIAEDHASAIDIAMILGKKPDLLKDILRYVKKSRPIVQQGINMSRLPQNILSAAVQDSNDPAKMRLYAAMGSNDSMDEYRYQLLWQKIKNDLNTIKPGVTIEGIEERITDLIEHELVPVESEDIVIPGFEDFQAMRSESDESIELRAAIRRFFQREAKILGQTLRDQNRRILESAEFNINADMAEQIRNANIDVLKEWSRVIKFDKGLREWIGNLADKNKNAPSLDAVVQDNIEEIKRVFQDARMRFIQGIKDTKPLEGIDEEKSAADVRDSASKGQSTPQTQSNNQLIQAYRSQLQAELQKLREAKPDRWWEIVPAKTRASIAQQILVDAGIIPASSIPSGISREAWYMVFREDLANALQVEDDYKSGLVYSDSEDMANLVYEKLFLNFVNQANPTGTPDSRKSNLTELTDFAYTAASMVPEVAALGDDVPYVARTKETGIKKAEDESMTQNLSQQQRLLIKLISDNILQRYEESERKEKGYVYWLDQQLEWKNSEHEFLREGVEKAYAKIKSSSLTGESNADGSPKYSKTFAEMRKEAVKGVIQEDLDSVRKAYAKYKKTKLLADLYEYERIANKEINDFLSSWEAIQKKENQFESDQIEDRVSEQDDESQMGLFNRIMTGTVKPRSKVNIDNNVLALTQDEKMTLRSAGFVSGNNIDFAAINILGSQKEGIFSGEISVTEYPSDSLHSSAFGSLEISGSVDVDGGKMSFTAYKISDKNSLALNIRRLIGITKEGKKMTGQEQIQAANNIADYMNMLAHAVVSRRLRAMADAALLGTFGRRYQGDARIPSTRNQREYLEFDGFVQNDLNPLYADFRKIFDAEYLKKMPSKNPKRLNGNQIFQSTDPDLVSIRSVALARLSEQETIKFFNDRFPAIGHVVKANTNSVNGMATQGMVTRFALANGMSTKILFAFNNTSIEVMMHEIAHGWLDALPYYAAEEIASAMNKTLRQPTPTHLSYIPFEMHEEFAYGLMLSLANVNLEKPAAKLGWNNPQGFGWADATGTRISDPSNPVIKAFAEVGKLIRQAYDNINAGSNIFSTPQHIGVRNDSFFGTWKIAYQIPNGKDESGNPKTKPDPRLYLWRNAPVTVLLRKEGFNDEYRLARLVDDVGLVSNGGKKIRVYLDKSKSNYEDLSKDITEIRARDILYIGGRSNGVSNTVQEIISNWISGNSGFLGLENSAVEEREKAYTRDDQLLSDQLALEFGTNYNPLQPAVIARRQQLIDMGFNISAIRNRGARKLTKIQKARSLAENFGIGRIADTEARDLADSISDDDLRVLWDNRVSLMRDFMEDPFAILEQDTPKGRAMVSLLRSGVKTRVMQTLDKNSKSKDANRSATKQRALKTLSDPQAIEKLVTVAFHTHLLNTLNRSQVRDDVRKITGNLNLPRTYSLGKVVQYDKASNTITMIRNSDGKVFHVNLNDGSVLDDFKIPDYTDEELEEMHAEGITPQYGIKRRVNSWYGPARGIDQFQIASMWSKFTENPSFGKIQLTVDGKRIQYPQTTLRKMNARMFEIAAETGLMSGKFGDVKRTKGSSFYVAGKEFFIAEALFGNTPEAFAGMTLSELTDASPEFAHTQMAQGGRLLDDVGDVSEAALANISLNQSTEINRQVWMHGSYANFTGVPLPQKSSLYNEVYFTNDIRTSLDYTPAVTNVFSDETFADFDNPIGNKIPIRIKSNQTSRPKGYVYLYNANVSNPLVVNADGMMWSVIDRNSAFTNLINDARSSGHDSVLVTNISDNMTTDVRSDVLIVFDPASVMSSVDNSQNAISNMIRETNKADYVAVSPGEQYVNDQAASDKSKIPYSQFNIPNHLLNTKYTEIANNGIVDPTNGMAIADIYHAPSGRNIKCAVASAEVIADTASHGIDSIIRNALLAASMGDDESYAKHLNWITSFADAHFKQYRQEDSYSQPNPSLLPSLNRLDGRAYFVGDLVIDNDRIKTSMLSPHLSALASGATLGKTFAQPNVFITSSVLPDGNTLSMSVPAEYGQTQDGYTIVPSLKLIHDELEMNHELIRELVDFAPHVFNGSKFEDTPGFVSVFMVPGENIGRAEANEWINEAKKQWESFWKYKTPDTKFDKYTAEVKQLALWNLGSSEFGGVGQFTEYDRVLDIVQALSFDDRVSFQYREKEVIANNISRNIDRTVHHIFSGYKQYMPLLGSNRIRRNKSSISVAKSIGINWDLQPVDSLSEDQYVKKAYKELTARLDEIGQSLKFNFEFAPEQSNADGTDIKYVDMYNSNPKNAFRDLYVNHHVFVPREIESTFGGDDSFRDKHPMWQMSNVKTLDGKPMRYIDVLNGLRRAFGIYSYMESFNGVGENLDYIGIGIALEDPWAIWALANETKVPNAYMQSARIGLNGEIDFNHVIDTDDFTRHKLSLPPFEDLYSGHSGLDDFLRAYLPRLKSEHGDYNGTASLLKIDGVSGSGNALESIGGSIMAFHKPGMDSIDIDMKNGTITGDMSNAGESFLGNVIFMPQGATRQQTMNHIDGTTPPITPSQSPNFNIRKAIRIGTMVLNELWKAGAAGDASPVLMQGYILSVDNPESFATQMRQLKGVITNPNLGLEFRGKVYNKEGMKGRRYFHESLDAVIRSRPTYQYAKEFGLTLAAANMEKELAKLRETNPEATWDDVDDLGDATNQEINLKFMRHLPGHGQSQRFYALAKDAQKMTAFDAFARHLIDAGYNPTPLYETDSDGNVVLNKYGNPKIINSAWNRAMAQTASLMNVASGDVRFAADDEIDRGISELYSLGIFSPRWWVSRMMLDRLSRSMFEMTGNKVGSAFGNPTWATKILQLNRFDSKSMQFDKRDVNVGKYHAKLMWQAWGLMMAFIALIYGSEALNPKTLQVKVDKDGTRLRIGDYTFRAFGSLTTGMEMFSAIGSGLFEWNARKGTVNEEPIIPFMLRKITSPLLTKASPVLSMAGEFITGRDPFGQPAFVPDEALKQFGDELVAPYLRQMGIRGFETPNINSALTKRVLWWWLHDVMDAYKTMRDSNMDKGESLLKASMMGAFSFFGGRVIYSPIHQQEIWKAQRRFQGTSGLDVFLGRSSGMDMITGSKKFADDPWEPTIEEAERYLQTTRPREYMFGNVPEAPGVWY